MEIGLGPIPFSMGNKILDSKIFTFQLKSTTILFLLIPFFIGVHKNASCQKVFDYDYINDEGKKMDCDYWFLQERDNEFYYLTSCLKTVEFRGNIPNSYMMKYNTDYKFQSSSGINLTIGSFINYELEHSATISKFTFGHYSSANFMWHGNSYFLVGQRKPDQDSILLYKFDPSASDFERVKNFCISLDSISLFRVTPFFYDTSSNGKFLLVLGLNMSLGLHGAITKNAIQYAVLDQSEKVVKRGLLNENDSLNERKIEDVMIDNSGNIFCLSYHFESTTEDGHNDNSFYIMELNDRTGKFINKRRDFKDGDIRDLQFVSIDTNYDAILGSYRYENTVNLKGLFLLPYEDERFANQFRLVAIDPNPLLLYVDDSRHDNILGGREKKSFNELNYLIDSHLSDANNLFILMRRRFYGISDYLAVISISKKWKENYCTDVPRGQNYFYSAIMKDGEVHIFYDEIKKNLEINKGESLTRNVGDPYPMHVAITSEGMMKREQILFTNSLLQYKTIPNSFFLNHSDQIVGMHFNYRDNVPILHVIQNF